MTSLVRDELMEVVSTRTSAGCASATLARAVTDVLVHSVSPRGLAGGPGGGTSTWFARPLSLVAWTVPRLLVTVVADRRRDLT